MYTWNNNSSNSILLSIVYARVYTIRYNYVGTRAEAHRSKWRLRVGYKLKDSGSKMEWVANRYIETKKLGKEDGGSCYHRPDVLCVQNSVWYSNRRIYYRYYIYY